MIRINRETDYGIGILSMLARDAGARVTASTLAERRGLPQPMVSKILKHLARAGILVSYRGAKGGYGLARDPDEITVAEIIAALEGPIALTECVEEGVEACQYSSYCHRQRATGADQPGGAGGALAHHPGRDERAGARDRRARWP
ncbi:MAG: Rrf2 family transcriptional regulator [Arhodomonas sp.]|nr:Rrf2 family transcriptional regulator [Arhodomonas sp.]